MGGMLGNKRQDRGKKNFRGPEIWGGTFGGNAKKGWNNFWGECCGTCEPQQILGGNFWKNVKEKNLGGKFWGGSTKGACDLVGMVRSEKKGKDFPKKNSGTFLGGGSYKGGRVWGKCWEIKDKIGEKKNSGGQKLLGGDFLGKCQKRGGKTFWRFQKVVGIFLGVTTIFWGENFSGKI